MQKHAKDIVFLKTFERNPLTLQCFFLLMAETCNKTMFFQRICWTYSAKHVFFKNLLTLQCFFVNICRNMQQILCFWRFSYIFVDTTIVFLMFAETCKRYCFFQDFLKKSFDTTMFFVNACRNMQQNNIFSRICWT